MRTTVTLDPDVAALIRRVMKERGLSFREALNSAVRAGLASQPARAFVQKTARLGSEQTFPWDKALDFAAAIEDEDLSRKM